MTDTISVFLIVVASEFHLQALNSSQNNLRHRCTNDQCIGSLIHITDNLEAMVNLMLLRSQYEEVLVIFSKTIICLVVDECWTEENDVIQLSLEGAAQEIDQVSCLS